MTMQSFLGGILSGALTTDATTWISPSFPNGYSFKKSVIIENDAGANELALIGPQGGALTNSMLTTIYVVVTAMQLAGTSSPDGAEYQLKAVYRRNTTLTAVKAPTVVDSNPNANGAAWTAILSPTSGQGVSVIVQDSSGTKTIRWSCLVTLYEG